MAPGKAWRRSSRGIEHPRVRRDDSSWTDTRSSFREQPRACGDRTKRQPSPCWHGTAPRRRGRHATAGPVGVDEGNNSAFAGMLSPGGQVWPPAEQSRVCGDDGSSRLVVSGQHGTTPRLCGTTATWQPTGPEEQPRACRAVPNRASPFLWDEELSPRLRGQRDHRTTGGWAAANSPACAGKLAVARPVHTADGNSPA